MQGEIESDTPSARMPCTAEAAVTPNSFNTPLPSSVLNIDAKSRSNLFPWRGQFSPQLVEAVLRAYAPANATVLDPFMGSGTVLVEAARLGMAAYGYEVNPSAYLLSRVYELCRLPVHERLRLLNASESILRQVRPSAFEPSLFWSKRGCGAASQTLSRRIRDTIDPRVRGLLEALVVLLDDERFVDDDTYARMWSKVCAVVSGLPYSRLGVRAWLGDARALDLPDNAVDFVLTSPPYINVFNYHHNSRTGVEMLGWKPLVVARSEIGSNRKFRHNRFLTVIQYCIDMALALCELSRVCRRSARLILVVGRESNVQKTPFYNSDILKRLATDVIGMHLHQQQERVFVNRFGRRIYEDLLHLTPAQGCSLNEQVVVEEARVIGRDILCEALDRAPLDRMHDLLNAINEAEKVEASPVLDPCAIYGSCGDIAQ